MLMCSASIWHMCTMSMDRYFTLNYPMRYGRNKTRRMVAGKILFVWVVSICIALPICIYGFVDSSIVYNEGICVPVLKNFIILGSIFAFYIPLLIMLVTYVLTIRILWRNEHRMQEIDRSDLKPRLAQLTAQCTGFAIPKLVASLRRSTRAGSKKIAALRAGDQRISATCHHIQSQSNPSLAMYATDNRLASSRSCYSPMIKKCSSQPKFGVSVSFFKETQYVLTSSRTSTLQNQTSKHNMSESTLANSLERLKGKDNSSTCGMSYLRPPSSLTHSVMSASPLSSPSTVNSPSPYPCEESDDYRDEEEEDYDSGEGTKYFRQLRSPTSPSCKPLYTPVSLNGSDKSLHRRLQQRQLFLSHQKEANHHKHKFLKQQERREQLQQQQQQQLQTEHGQQHGCIRQGQTSELDSERCVTDCPSNTINNKVHCSAPHKSTSLVAIASSQSATNQAQTGVLTPKPLCPSSAKTMCTERSSISSSVSTPSISVYCCAQDTHIQNNTPQTDHHFQHIANGSVCKELTRTQSHPVQPLSSILSNKCTLSQSQTTSAIRQCANIEGSTFEITEKHSLVISADGSVRRKRYSKRSKKNRNQIGGSPKCHPAPGVDPFLSGQANHNWFLQVPKQSLPWQQHTDKQTCGHAGLTAALSDTYVSHAGRDGAKCERGRCEGGDRGGLCLSSIPLGHRRPHLDYKSMEWDRRYFQVRTGMIKILSKLRKYMGKLHWRRHQVGREQRMNKILITKKATDIL